MLSLNKQPKKIVAEVIFSFLDIGSLYDPKKYFNHTPKINCFFLVDQSSLVQSTDAPLTFDNHSVHVFAFMKT